MIHYNADVRWSAYAIHAVFGVGDHAYGLNVCACLIVCACVCGYYGKLKCWLITSELIWMGMTGSINGRDVVVLCKLMEAVFWWKNSSTMNANQIHLTVLTWTPLIFEMEYAFQMSISYSFPKSFIFAETDWLYNKYILLADFSIYQLSIRLILPATALVIAHLLPNWVSTN